MRGGLVALLLVFISGRGIAQTSLLNDPSNYALSSNVYGSRTYSFNPSLLEIGQSILFNFIIQYTSTPGSDASGLRFGLGTANAKNYHSYFALGGASAGTGFGIGNSTTLSSSIFIGGIGDTSKITNTSSHTIGLLIERKTDGYQLSSSLDGTSYVLSNHDTNGVSLGLGIASGAGFNSAIIGSSFSATVSSAVVSIVPEPTVLSLCFIGLGTLLGVRQRKA